MNIVVRGGAVWIAGRWVKDARDRVVTPADADARAAIAVQGLFPGDRIPRADRVTQLGALVLAGALAELPPRESEGVAMLTASVLATSHTNEKFERRRMEGKPPEPRAFPYTAPNAAAGEFAIAAVARGPTLALVGGPEVGIAALERAIAWLRHERCVRAVVVATECPPPTPASAAPVGVVPIECAAAIVVERSDADDRPGLPIRITWQESAHTDAAIDPLLSVGPLADVILACRTHRAGSIVVASDVGSAMRVEVGVSGQ